MIDPTTASEILLFSTVRIQTKTNDGIEGIGTGFFFYFRFDDQTDIPMIVTNKHVIKGAGTGYFLLHESEESEGKNKPLGKFIPVSMNDFESLWIPHPDENIDLCAMPVKPLLVEMEKLNKNFFATYLYEGLILSDDKLKELKAVEDVLMIGYPNGLWDEANNLPLVRRGITSSHPAIDFNGETKGVVDIACFPGSSGSPVFIFNDGTYSVKPNIVHTGHRTILLGVLFAGPVWTVEGEIAIREIPTHAIPISKTNMMIHLGFIIKAKEIIRLGDHIRESLKTKGAVP